MRKSTFRDEGAVCAKAQHTRLPSRVLPGSKSINTEGHSDVRQKKSCKALSCYPNSPLKVPFSQKDMTSSKGAGQILRHQITKTGRGRQTYLFQPGSLQDVKRAPHGAPRHSQHEDGRAGLDRSSARPQLAGGLCEGLHQPTPSPSSHAAHEASPSQHRPLNSEFILCRGKNLIYSLKHLIVPH